MENLPTINQSGWLVVFFLESRLVNFPKGNALILTKSVCYLYNIDGTGHFFVNVHRHNYVSKLLNSSL